MYSDISDKKMEHLPDQVHSFSLLLQQRQADFICTTDLPASTAAVAFIGHFQGQTVLWQMTLATLQHYRQTQSAAAANPNCFSKPFIDILPGQQGGFPLHVGLELEVIDEAVIKKTIIMLRNYKRLAIGRMEFGSMHG
jgi:hypothetical protein